MSRFLLLVVEEFNRKAIRESNFNNLDKSSKQNFNIPKLIRTENINLLEGEKFM